MYQLPAVFGGSWKRRWLRVTKGREKKEKVEFDHFVAVMGNTVWKMASVELLRMIVSCLLRFRDGFEILFVTRPKQFSAEFHFCVLKYEMLKSTET